MFQIWLDFFLKIFYFILLFYDIEVRFSFFFFFWCVWLVTKWERKKKFSFIYCFRIFNSFLEAYVASFKCWLKFIIIILFIMLVLWVLMVRGKWANAHFGQNKQGSSLSLKLIRKMPLFCNSIFLKSSYTKNSIIV